MPDDPAGKLGQTGPANRYAAVSIIHNYLSLNYLTQTKSFPGQRKWPAAGAFVTGIVHARVLGPVRGEHHGVHLLHCIRFY